MLNSHQIHT